MVLQSQLNFSYVCFSYVKAEDQPFVTYTPWPSSDYSYMRERNRRYAEKYNPLWKNFIMSIEWKKLEKEYTRKREGGVIFVPPDPTVFRPG